MLVGLPERQSAPESPWAVSRRYMAEDYPGFPSPENLSFSLLAKEFWPGQPYWTAVPE